ncbi:GAF domain-containing protein, partial [Streptomyces griseoflavus Tu4000]
MATPWVHITSCVGHFTVRTCWRITPPRRAGGTPWAGLGQPPRPFHPYCVYQKNGRGVGVAKSGVYRRACFSPPPPREDGARSSVVKTPGSVARFPSGSQPPLAFTEYVPITTVVTLRRARPVDRNRPHPEAVSSQLRIWARGLRGVPGDPTDTRNPSRTMLDISSRVRVHVETLPATQNDMGVCDAFEQFVPVRKPDTMTAPHPPKVAGIDSTVPAPAHTAASVAAGTSPAPPANSHTAPGALLQDRLAGWVSDLTTLQELTERLVRASTLEEALQEMLRAGSVLVGARRGLVALEPADGLGPASTTGLGLARADLGHMETVPRGSLPYGRILDGLPGTEDGVAEPDLLAEQGLDPRHREVAARLGYAASYALPLTSRTTGRLGAAAWLYDEPAEPSAHQRHLVGLYVRHAAEHLARLLELEHTRACMATLAEELLPSRLPRVAGVRLAARHLTSPRGGGDWYDALPL